MMKKAIALVGLLFFSLQASARAADCQDVGARLNALATANQQIRLEAETLNRNPKATDLEKEAIQKRWREIDSGNLKQFKDIIAACGWPKEAKDSHSAWLLAQHADSDLAFQRQAKDLLEASVKAGIGAARDLAYLADRIAAAEGRPQEYGTQFMVTDRCHLALKPVDNRELVDRRRLAVGLQSLDAYEAEARRRALPADCAK
jgi:hypothetical protein